MRQLCRMYIPHLSRNDVASLFDPAGRSAPSATNACVGCQFLAQRVYLFKRPAERTGVSGATMSCAGGADESGTPVFLREHLGKNDRNDAEAICEAAGRPGMHFVPVKSVTQQAQGMVLKVRETLVGQRTQLVNTLRGHAAEFGVIVAKGIRQVAPLLAAIDAETTIPPEAKDMAAVLGQEIEHLDTRIKEIEAGLIAAHKANEVSQRLATIPGVGPVTALTLATELNPTGRHLAAWVGLTPKEHSTAGRQRMGGISRAGNERLRVLLVIGATSVIKAAAGGIEGNVNIEHDPARYVAEAVAVEIDHGVAHAQQGALVRQVLQSRDGRLRAQCVVLRQMPHWRSDMI